MYLNGSTSSFAAVPKIPVWVYIIANNNGTTNFTPESVSSAILSDNAVFTGIFNFVVCGTTTIKSDTYYDFNLSEMNDLCNYVNGLSETKDDKCVKVFMVGNLTVGNLYVDGYGIQAGGSLGTPFANAGIIVDNMQSHIFAHELGHYFGLPHTFANGYFSQFVSTDPIVCYNTGDSFCDTPADPGLNYNTNSGSGSCTQQTCETVTCTTNDPLGVPYSPDPRLVMGYYSSLGCNDRFSNEQKAFMRAVYLIEPQYEPLRNPDAECVLTKVGNIKRFCDLPSGAFISPMPTLPVAMQENVIQLPCLQNTDNDGVYLTQFCPSTPVRKVLPVKSWTANTTQPAYLDPLNGVTSFDLVKISSHLLGTEIITSPFRLIAADANNSGGVSNSDITVLRKLILGVIPSLEVGSWRYIPRLWLEQPVFANAFFDPGALSVNPFDAQVSDINNNITRKYLSATGIIPNNDSWMDHVNIVPTSTFAQDEVNWSFYGVKVGDLTCNANMIPGPPEVPPTYPGFSNWNNQAINFNLDGIKNIEVVAVSPKPVSAWQMGVRFASNSFDITQLNDSNIGLDLTADNIFLTEETSQNEGYLALAWNSADGTPVNISNQPLFSFNMTAQKYISSLSQELLTNNTVTGIHFFDVNGTDITSSVQLYLRENNSGLNGGAGDRQNLIESVNELLVTTQPSPFKEVVEFTVLSPDEAEGNISVFNISGELIYQSQLSLMKGRNAVSVESLSGMPGGIYWYVVQVNDKVKTGKIVKI